MVTISSVHSVTGTDSREVISGRSAIEKVCISDAALLQEYGQAGHMAGCASTWGGRVNYCICSSHKCNEWPISVQMGYNQPITEARPRPEQPVALPAPNSPTEPAASVTVSGVIFTVKKVRKTLRLYFLFRIPSSVSTVVNRSCTILWTVQKCTNTIVPYSTRRHLPFFV